MKGREKTERSSADTLVKQTRRPKNGASDPCAAVAHDRVGRRVSTSRVRVAARLGAACALLFATTRAEADSTEDLRGLLDETVVTTASKSKETASSAPATSTMLSADDMRRYGIHSIDEAINFLSLGASTYNPFFTPHLSVRGVGFPGDLGSHVLLLVDGHTMNDALFGSAQFGRGVGVPMEMIDHVEVILGPGSVLYGSSAMLGVINIVTKRGKEHRGGHVALETEVPISYRGSFSAGIPFEAFGAPGEVVAGVEFFRSDGPYFKMGPQPTGPGDIDGLPRRLHRWGVADSIWGGTPEHVPYNQAPSAYLSARAGDFRLHLQASSFKYAAAFRSRGIQTNIDFDDPDSYQIERALRGDLIWQRPVSELVTLTARGYFDSFDKRSFTDVSDSTACRYPGTLTCTYVGTGVTRWGGTELQSSFNWTRDGRLVTLLGIDARWRYVQGKNEISDYDTHELLAPPNGLFKRTGPTLGPYLQTTWQPAPAISFNAGARLDYDSRFDPVISPRLAAMTHPWHDGTVKAVYSEAFRAPSFVESDQVNIIILPAGKLVPETVRSVEGSVEQRFGSQRIMFGAFRSWRSNMIEFHVLTPEEKQVEVAAGRLDISLGAAAVSQYRNVASMDNYGFNGTYEGSAVGGRLRYAANVTGAIARRVTGNVDQQIPLSPMFFGNLRTSFDLQGQWPVLAVASYFTGRTIADRAWDGGWAVFPVAPAQIALRGTISGPVPGLRGLSYRLSANYNFADRGPYVIGFIQGGNTGIYQPAELIPVDRFRATVGLQYDFLQ